MNTISNMSVMESASITFNGTSRFLQCLYEKCGNELKSREHLETLLDAEIEKMQQGFDRIPDFQKQTRAFHECHMQLQMGLLMCTRIATISKILFILNDPEFQYGQPLSIQRAVQTLSYIKSILQSEYYDQYHEYYGLDMDDETVKYFVNGKSTCFAEHEIYKDMHTYFNQIAFRSDIFSENYRFFMGYMCMVYLQVEYDMISMDLKYHADFLSRNGRSFMEYHNYFVNANNELSFWYNFINEFHIYETKIKQYLAVHQTICFPLKN